MLPSAPHENRPHCKALSATVLTLCMGEIGQGHLAVTQDPTRMLISWTTKNSTTPKVKWGLTSGQYTASSNGTTTTYTSANMCSGPANGTG